MNLKITILILILLISVTSFTESAVASSDTWDYPRTANYFLDSYLHPDEGRLLAKWDVLILSAAAQEWRPEVFKTIRQKNPDVIILAYVSVSGVSRGSSDFERFQSKDYDNIPSNWWLKSSSQDRLGYWPGANILNVTDLSPTNTLGQRWNEWLPEWIADNIYSTGYWDGIFLDEAFPAVSWINSGDIDLNGDGVAEDKETINTAWQAGVEKITKNLRDRIGPNAYLEVNGASSYTTYTNGRMHENIFRVGGNWSNTMNSYIDTQQASGYEPKLSLINSNTGNTGNLDHRAQLYGLTSTLLGDGFYSYDFGDQKHMSIWWSKEYEKNLGQPLNQARNINGANDQGFIPGLWRRDFTNGSVLVNSTNEKTEYEISFKNKYAKGLLEPYSGVILTAEEFSLSELSNSKGNIQAGNQGSQGNQATEDKAPKPDKLDPSIDQIIPADIDQPESDLDMEIKTPSTSSDSIVLEKDVSPDQPLKSQDSFGRQLYKKIKQFFQSIYDFFRKLI